MKAQRADVGDYLPFGHLLQNLDASCDGFVDVAEREGWVPTLTGYQFDCSELFVLFLELHEEVDGVTLHMGVVELYGRTLFDDPIVFAHTSMALPLSSVDLLSFELFPAIELLVLRCCLPKHLPAPFPVFQALLDSNHLTLNDNLKWLNIQNTNHASRNAAITSLKIFSTETSSGTLAQAPYSWISSDSENFYFEFDSSRMTSRRSLIMSSMRVEFRGVNEKCNRIGFWIMDNDH